MGRLSDGVTFNLLRSANENRQQEWPGVPFRAIEFAGEVGELSEAIKKWLLAERCIRGSTATEQDFASEMMGDVIVALDLLACEMGIDLGEAVRKKFNATSEKYSLRTYIGSDGDWHLHPAKSPTE